MTAPVLRVPALPPFFKAKHADPHADGTRPDGGPVAKDHDMYSPLAMVTRWPSTGDPARPRRHPYRRPGEFHGAARRRVLRPTGTKSNGTAHPHGPIGPRAG